jgi:hypothetical protein
MHVAGSAKADDKKKGTAEAVPLCILT